jgi:hypothetical protein
MRQHFWVIGLDKLDPRRAATGKLRQGLRFVDNPVDQLGGFFHNSHVSAKIGVQHIIRAQRPQRTHHFPFDKCPRRKSKLLAQADTHRRRCVENHDFIRVSKRLFHLGILVLLGNRVNRAYIGALPTVDANRIISSAFHIVHSADRDIGLADTATSPAFNAKLLVPHNGGIPFVDGNTNIRKPVFTHTNLLWFLFAILTYTAEQ